MPTIAAVRTKKKASPKFTNLLNKFLHAAYFYQQKGAYHPNEFKEINDNYRITKQKLVGYVADLEARVNVQRAD